MKKILQEIMHAHWNISADINFEVNLVDRVIYRDFSRDCIISDAPFIC